MKELSQIVTSPLGILGELELQRHTYKQRGLDLAWDDANKFMSLKKGYPIFVGGAAGSGKSEFCLDLILNTSIMYGWKWLIVSPETGSDIDIINELIMKLSKGYDISLKEQNPIEPKQYEKIIKWLHKHFRIIDKNKSGGWKELMTSEYDLTIKNLFEVVDRLESDWDSPFDGILIDPFNEMIDLGGNIAGMVKNELDLIINYTKRKNIVTILTNHANDKKEMMTKVNEKPVFWKPPVTKEEWAYGQQFARKGYQMILLYEQPHAFQVEGCNEGNVYNMESVKHDYNHRQILVQKTKPKGVGRTGLFNMFYDRTMQRYYEVDSLGMKKDIIYPNL